MKTKWYLGCDNIARLSICKGCNKELQSNERYTYSNKSYCLDCYNTMIAEHNSYESLLKLICEYYNVDMVSGLILKQIKQYKDEFNYTYDGMSYSLWYCKEILKKQFILKYGIAILKYEYENAKLYYSQQCQIQQSVNNQNPTVIKKVIQNYKAKPTTNFLLNIDDIVNGGDGN